MKLQTSIKDFKALHKIIKAQTSAIGRLQVSHEQLLNSFFASRCDLTSTDKEAAEKIKALVAESYDLRIRKIALEKRGASLMDKAKSILGPWYERAICWLNEPVSWGGKEVQIEIVPHYVYKPEQLKSKDKKNVKTKHTHAA